MSFHDFMNFFFYMKLNFHGLN